MQAEHAHPGGAVGLLQVAAGGEGFAAVEDADVVETEEPTLKDVAPGVVLAVDPPGEVHHQLVENPFQEGAVLLAGDAGVDVVDAPGGPGDDGWVDVVEGPLVGRNLAVGVHVPLAQEEDELAFGESGIDAGEGHAVEGQVPGGVPGVFPGIGHGEDVGVIEMAPAGVAAVFA